MPDAGYYHIDHWEADWTKDMFQVVSKGWLAAAFWRVREWAFESADGTVIVTSDAAGSSSPWEADIAMTGETPKPFEASSGSLYVTDKIKDEHQIILNLTFPYFGHAPGFTAVDDTGQIPKTPDKAIKIDPNLNTVGDPGTIMGMGWYGRNVFVCDFEDGTYGVAGAPIVLGVSAGITKNLPPDPDAPPWPDPDNPDAPQPPTRQFSLDASNQIIFPNEPGWGTSESVGTTTIKIEGFPDVAFDNRVTPSDSSPAHVSGTNAGADDGAGATESLTTEISSFNCTLKAAKFWEYDGRWNSDGSFNRF